MRLKLILILLYFLDHHLISAQCVDAGIALVDSVCYPTTTTRSTQKTSTTTARTSKITTSSIPTSTETTKKLSTTITTRTSTPSSTVVPSSTTFVSKNYTTSTETAATTKVETLSTSTKPQEIHSKTSSTSQKSTSQTKTTNEDSETDLPISLESSTIPWSSSQGTSSSDSVQPITSLFSTNTAATSFRTTIETSTIQNATVTTSSLSSKNADSTTTKQYIPSSESSKHSTSRITLTSSAEPSFLSSARTNSLSTSSETSLPTTLRTSTTSPDTTSELQSIQPTSVATMTQTTGTSPLPTSSKILSTSTELEKTNSHIGSTTSSILVTSELSSQPTSYSVSETEPTEKPSTQRTEEEVTSTPAVDSSVETSTSSLYNFTETQTESSKPSQTPTPTSGATMKSIETISSEQNITRVEPKRTTVFENTTENISTTYYTEQSSGETSNAQKTTLYRSNTEKNTRLTTVAEKGFSSTSVISASTQLTQETQLESQHTELSTTMMEVHSTGLATSSFNEITTTSTSEQILTEEVITANTTKYEEPSTSTTKSLTHIPTSVATTTTKLPEKCVLPCESDYFEGESFCYIQVPIRNVRRYSFALAYCQQTRQADLADEFDFMSNFLLFQNLDDDKDSSLYFINEYGSRTMREEKSVRVIDLLEVTRFQARINKTITVDTDETDVKALCRRPKYCAEPTCRLSLYYSEIINKLELENNVTLKPGQETTINCKAPSADKVSVFCGNRGQIIPHSSLVQCTTPKDDSNSTEVELPDNQEVRSSCSECFSGGTDSCEPKQQGFVCNCKAGWTRFTCWKAPEFCSGEACEHGECISLIDKFVCVCYEGYGGERCEILKNLPESMFSTATAVALASSAASSISLLQKFIRFRIVTGDLGDDPQEVFMGFRAVAFTIGTMMMSFFSHPHTMAIDPAACRFYNWIIYFCFLLAQTMSMNEALNLCTTMKGVNRNEWEYDSKGRKRWWISYRIRIGMPFIFSAACVSLIFCKSWENIPSSWTCTGVYSEDRTSIWLPFAYLNVACVIGTLCFAECAVHIYNHSPMGLLNVYHFYDNRNPMGKNNIEKVVRNLPFAFMNPIILFFFFLTFTLNADNQNKYLNGSYLVISIIYNLVFFLQVLITTPEVYDFFLKCLMRFLPPSLVPSYTPITLLRPEEIKEISRSKGRADLPPNHPAHPGYISKETKHFIKRRLTYSYINHRLSNSLSPQEAVENVISEELHNRLIFCSLPKAKHMEIIVRDWANSMIARDKIKIGLKNADGKTKEKFHARAAKILDERESPNMKNISQSQELRFLLNILNFKPAQPGPFLKLPINNGNRTELIYFTPRTSPRTKYELQIMNEKFEKCKEKMHKKDKKNKAIGQTQSADPRDSFFDSNQPGFIGPITQSDSRNMPGLKKYLQMETFKNYSTEEWQRLEDHFDYFESIKINR